MAWVWSVAAVLLGFIAWVDGGLIWGFLVAASLASLGYLHDIAVSLRILSRDESSWRNG